MTDATPTQPTGSGKLIWRKPLTRDVVTFGTLPDPRDARIAELEGALQMILRDLGQYPETTEREKRTQRTIGAALMPPPEGDMTITQEAMDA